MIHAHAAGRRRRAIGLACGLVCGLATILGPAAALACACCVDRGDRSIQLWDPVEAASLMPQALAALGWRGPARGVGAFGDADGFAADLAIDATVGPGGEALEMTLTPADPAARARIIRLVLPERFERRAVDPEPGAAPIPQLRLYIEWVLSGAVVGDIGPGGPARGALILHGAGDACAGGDDLRHFTFEYYEADAVAGRLFGPLPAGLSR